MKFITKIKLATIHNLCDAEDKSTEYMIQYMQDTVKVDHDTVIAYLTMNDKLIKEARQFVNDYSEFMNNTFG